MNVQDKMFEANRLMDEGALEKDNAKFLKGIYMWQDNISEAVCGSDDDFEAFINAFPNIKKISGRK